MAVELGEWSPQGWFAELALVSGCRVQVGYSFELRSFFSAAFTERGVFVAGSMVGGPDVAPLRTPAAFAAALVASGAELQVFPGTPLWRALHVVHARVASAA